MALKPCPECGESISTKAFDCPKCGAPLKKKKGKGIHSSSCGGCLMVGILGIVVLVLVIPMVTRNRNEPPPFVPSAPTPAQVNPAVNPKTPNEAHNQLIALTEDGQKHVLQDILVKSGKPCDKITRILFRGLDPEHTAHWTVQDESGQLYGIGVYNDAEGSTGIVSEAALKVSGIDPWKTFE